MHRDNYLLDSLWKTNRSICEQNRKKRAGKLSCFQLQYKHNPEDGSQTRSPSIRVQAPWVIPPSLREVVGVSLRIWPWCWTGPGGRFVDVYFQALCTFEPIRDDFELFYFLCLKCCSELRDQQKHAYCHLFCCQKFVFLSPGTPLQPRIGFQPFSSQRSLF